MDSSGKFNADLCIVVLPKNHCDTRNIPLKYYSRWLRFYDVRAVEMPLYGNFCELRKRPNGP